MAFTLPPILTQILPYGGSKQVRRATEALSVALGTLNNAGICSNGNDAFRKIFGTDPFICKNPVFLSMLRISEQDLRQLLLQGDINKSCEGVAVRNQKGETIYLKYSLRRVRSNQIQCEVQDITSDKGHELAQTRERERFMAVGESIHQILHSLKNALGSIMVNVEVLKGYNLPEPINSPIKRIENALFRLQNIIHEILNTGAEKTVVFSEFNMRQLLEEVVSQDGISSRLQTGKIELKIAGNCLPVNGSVELLRDAFTNLISNAIDSILLKKITDGKININISQHAEELEVSVSVQDNGIGILPEFTSKIFKYFFTTKRAGVVPGVGVGSGIGLPTAQDIIEKRHGGRIKVTSQPGEGATFTVYLPYHPKPIEPVHEKMDVVRASIAKLDNRYQQLSDQVIRSMTPEHIQESSTDQLYNQIKGQIDRLEEFKKTRKFDIWVNNLSDRTEIVLTGKKDWVSRIYWAEVIWRELQRIGNFEFASVAATRYLEDYIPEEELKLVCRIFEIRTLEGGRIPEEARELLDKVLLQKLTPLPSIPEITAQNLFLTTGVDLLNQVKTGSLHSLIYSPAVNNSKYRLAGYKLRVLQKDQLRETQVRQAEAAVSFLLTDRPELTGKLLELVQNAQAGNLVQKRVSRDCAEAIAENLLHVSPFNINYALISAFTTPQQAANVNLLFSKARFTPEIEQRFYALNQAYQRSLGG